MAHPNKPKSLRDQLTYFYIRRIKKAMLCPSCNDDHSKLYINKRSTVWRCPNCGYRLSANEFEKDYVFWFCDACGEFLNKQAGFNVTSLTHICKNCGCINNTTPDNIKGICSNCGQLVKDADSTMCEDCRTKQKDEIIKALEITGLIIAAAGAAVAVNAVVRNKKNSENCIYTEKWFNNASKDTLDVEREKVRQVWCHAGSDHLSSSEVATLENLLKAFDDELRRRNGSNSNGKMYPYNREHGWNLYKDD